VSGGAADDLGRHADHSEPGGTGLRTTDPAPTIDCADLDIAEDLGRADGAPRRTFGWRSPLSRRCRQA
jgi:hypothetical protein